MVPEQHMPQPDTVVDYADAKEHLVTVSDVISLDSDSHSGMTGSPTPSADGGLQLFDEARKNQ
jgi:hypothetical protein